MTGCSNMFYSSPRNLISPGLARVMGEGWETARRRDDGNDWVEFRLAGAGVVRLAELDTSYFLGNAPGWASLRAVDARAADPADPGAWTNLLPRTRLLPDTRHRFRLDAGAEATHVRLDVYPDGGMARVRLVGRLAPAARDELALRWLNLLPEGHARQVLASEGGLEDAEAARLAGARPWTAWPCSPSPWPRSWGLTATGGRLSRAARWPWGVLAPPGQLLELGHVVELGAHGDVGHPFQDDLDHHRHPELGQQLLGLLEGTRQLLGPLHPQRLAAEPLGHLDVVDPVAAELGRVHVVERQLHAEVHVEAALGLADQAQVAVVHHHVEIGQVELGPDGQLLDHELEVVVARQRHHGGVGVGDTHPRAAGMVQPSGPPGRS